MTSQLDEHFGYVADSLRLAHFEAAIAAVVRRGDRVADLGCGSGILGLLCLRAGAAQVYAIDSTAMIGVAEESLTRAGWGGQATLIHGKAHQIELPERVDVVICDQVGYFGFDYGIVESLADAKRRFLKPGGTLIPARIKLQLGAVESEKCHALAEGWAASGIPAEFHWLREHAVNIKHAVQLQKDELLGAPANLGEIDLRNDNPDFHSWTAELRIERDGILHGLAGWFECELAEGVWMTNSPLSEQAIKRPQAFLPIGEAIAVKAGDAITATVMARPADRLIAWQLELPASGRKFSHSTWLGELLTPEEIARRNPAHVPRPSRTGLARICVLGYCDGQRTVKEIEQAVLHEHPNLFPSTDEI
ncbi:MAG: class I SAM-dependent methyltransferase, partial [Dokdonella sp.]